MFQNPNNKESDNKPFNSKEISNELNKEDTPNLSNLVKSPNILSFEYISKNWKIFLNNIQTERPSISAMLEDYSPTKFESNTLFIKSDS